MSSRFLLAKKQLLWLGLLAPLVILARLITVHAQTSEQLTVYSPQTTYSVGLVEVNGAPYAGLVDVLEPLGSIDARPDGKKYKLKFTPPGGHAVEAQFNEGKDKAKVLGENLKLPSAFVLQNGRGYVPLSSIQEILNRLLAKPVQLHAAARRLFIGDVAIRFTVELEKGNPSKLVVSFPTPVNPTIATGPGGVRFTFRHEPVVSGGQDSFKFDDATITGASFPNMMGWRNST